MKPISHSGQILDAEFSVEEIGGQPTLIVESRSGGGRNADYHEALELLLARLKAMGASISNGIVDSTVSRRLPFDQRELDVRQRPYPIDLSQEADLRELRVALGAAQEPVAQRPGAKGGNRHKRIRLYLVGVEPEGLETQLAGGTGPSHEVSEALDAVDAVARPRRGGGQGRGLSAPARGAVELRAMKVIVDLLSDDGWAVEDVAADRRGYDLLAIRDGEELHVEVKGTTGTGASVLLTRGEVRHASEHSSQVALGVVSGIALRQKGEQWHGDGGQARIFWPWRLDEGVLEPVGFEWVLPPADEVADPG